MNIMKVIYASFIGSLAAIMVGSLCANNNPTTRKSIKINIDGYIFKLYPPNTDAQTEILHALYDILNYNADDYNQTDPEDELYKQYHNALNSVGHYSVLTWWNTLNSRTKYGKTIADLPRHTFSWYGNGSSYLQTIKIVLAIAIDKGKGNLTYQEFLNILELLYIKNNDYHNRLVKNMIEARNHLRSLA
jgi:hypothetical protein